MKYRRLITIDVRYGAHNIYVKTSKDGFMNAITISGDSDIVEHPINIKPNKQHFILHTLGQSVSNSFQMVYATSSHSFGIIELTKKCPIASD